MSDEEENGAAAAPPAGKSKALPILLVINTLLLTDWVAHTPPEILAANFGVPADAFSKTAQPLDFPGPGAWQPAGRPRRLRP